MVGRDWTREEQEDNPEGHAKYLRDLEEETRERPRSTSWGCTYKLGILAFMGLWSIIMYHGCRMYLEDNGPEQTTYEVRQEY